MSRFRLLLAWLVMAAIPLQGLAAASMLYCGMGAHHSSGEAVTLVQDSEVSVFLNEPSGHDHAQHNSPVGEVQLTKTADESGKTLPDAAHKCGVCASCCHSLAITEFPQTVVFSPLPQAELAEPFVLIQVRPSLVPDKPPRA